MVRNKTASVISHAQVGERTQRRGLITKSPRQWPLLPSKNDDSKEKVKARATGTAGPEEGSQPPSRSNHLSPQWGRTF